MAAPTHPVLTTGGRFGQEGTNTRKPPTCGPPPMIELADGFGAVAPGHMYRPGERHPGRREPQFPGPHNLHETVVARTLAPPPLETLEHELRALIWEVTADAVRKAIEDIPSGSHVVVCANSGPKNAQLEDIPPWEKTPGATCGLLFVVEFRNPTPGSSANDGHGIHPGWRQIAVPIVSNEGRLLAGLRLLPAATGRAVLKQDVNLVKDSPMLPYGSVSNSWSRIFASEYETLRASFAWDGDPYGWDEAVLFTRNPIMIMSNTRPKRRFSPWHKETVCRNANWLELVDNRLCGGFQGLATRKDVIGWDKDGIPDGELRKDNLVLYEGREQKTTQ
ncbi:hypothetical protein AB5N19_12530 [Seiridium cardinale]|uniref:Uncharacterized protein n=1 Tax=Seiridium cardinale TaxID=138064 RepID=A0ABR2XMD2_9PEZI